MNKHISIETWDQTGYEDFVDTGFAQKAWAHISSTDCRARMALASQNQTPAVVPLTAELITLIDKERLSDPKKARLMCMSMVDQVMKAMGYSHIACMFLPATEFVQTAAVYKKDT